MFSSFVRRLIIGALLVALAGCSALRLGYNQGPTLAFWWADRYVDFDATQSTRVREALNEWFRWHRATQLPDLDELLQLAQAQAVQPATASQVCQWADDLSARLMTAYEHAIPAIADIAMSLRPEQLNRLARRYESNNEDFRDEYLQRSPDDRLREAVKRASKRAEDFYGPLTVSQQELIKRRTRESPFNPELWLAERRARQQDILASLRRWSAERSPPQVVRAGLVALGQSFQRSSREPYRAYQQRLREYNCEFVAEFHNSSTPAQRQRVVDKLKNWDSDVRALIENGEP